jgi:Uma2 family endonuclease
MLGVENKRKYTDNDYALLEEGAPFQLINYDLIMSPSPIFAHQLILTNFIYAFKEFIKQENNKGVVVVSPMDVRLDEGNVFQPDLIFISEGRIAEIVKDRIEGAPDLVLEILSPSTAHYDLHQKKSIYEKYGVKEYIVIDPIAQCANLYTLRDNVYYLHKKAERPEKLSSLLLPGFVIDLEIVFEF